ncbi:MAG: hypothetical protein MRJ68_22485 [Nitrospira sp.]|nr:hypothetical protein [Nitrospira sp.]
MNFRTAVAVIAPSPIRVVAASDFGTTVSEKQFGNYIVTFPAHVTVLGCVATQNNSVGTVTAVPGSNSGLKPNEVSVSTLSLSNEVVGGLDFTLVAFYPAS